MKRLTLSLALASTFLTYADHSHDPLQEEALEIKGIFSVRDGYDTNDYVELPVWVNTPSTCWQLTESVAKVDHVQKKIFVTVFGHARKNLPCLEVLKSYLEVVKVGFLEQGSYTIESSSNPEIIDTISVATASINGPDDYLYAPVEEVEFYPVAASEGQSFLELEGHYPALINGCMRITSVEAEFLPNNILVVKPISSILKKEFCNSKDVDEHNHFKIGVSLNGTLIDKGLIHVRTLSGRSLNRSVNF